MDHYLKWPVVRLRGLSSKPMFRSGHHMSTVDDDSCNKDMYNFLENHSKFREPSNLVVVSAYISSSSAVVGELSDLFRLWVILCVLFVCKCPMNAYTEKILVVSY